MGAHVRACMWYVCLLCLGLAVLAPLRCSASGALAAGNEADVWREHVGGGVVQKGSHRVRHLSVAQCKARCVGGGNETVTTDLIWAGCKGFSTVSTQSGCTWVSQSSSLEDNAQGKVLHVTTRKLYTLLTARTKGANGCYLNTMKVARHQRHSFNSEENSKAASTYLTKHIDSYNTKATGNGDMGALCTTLMSKLSNHQPICGAPYTLPCSAACRNSTACAHKNCRNNGGPVGGVVNCHMSGKVATPVKKWDLGIHEYVTAYTYKTTYKDKKYNASDLVAVMDMCVSPCMQDNANRARHQCCVVPKQIASHFPCCREQGCCPDMKRRHAQVSVSVSVTVAVEDNKVSGSVYDALLRCLQNPAKLDSMCLTGSSGH